MTTRDDIKFCEPPAKQVRVRGRPASISRRLQPLRDRPGEWARVHGPAGQVAAQSWAQRLRDGGPAGIEPGEFEAIAREVDGATHVWARWVGNGEDR